MYVKYLISFGTIVSFVLFTFGIYYLTREIEPNLCQMTYMFQNPQFTPVTVDINKNEEKDEFSNYALYYYNEGYVMGDINNLNGAPVLFLPGNGGSYKQVRSLGSVALRMANGYNKPHLDYFTIDYDEELSAFYGGYLPKEKRFMELCIETILKLYKDDGIKYKRKITIIGHSMGGVLAKSSLNDAKLMEKVGIVIGISSPMDRPVVFMDYELDKFYQQTEEFLFDDKQKIDKTKSLGFTNNATKIPNVVFISIGGGNRDLLVPAALTESKHSDIHAMSTSIPNVWLTCDHLSAVWCLQLVKVVNRFLYGITFKATNGFNFFSTNAALNLQVARRHFIGYHTETIYREPTEFDFETWISTKNTNMSIVFERGIEKVYQQALILENLAPYEQIYISVIHEMPNSNWLFGCEHRNCVQNQVLTQHIYQLPSKRGHKSYALLNLPAIFGTFNNWTHLLIKLPMTRKYASLYYNINNVEDNLKTIKGSSTFKTQTGTIFQQLQIKGLTESFYTFKLNMPVLNCEKDFEAIVKIHVPWAKGYDRYYMLNPTNEQKQILINLPKNYIDESNTTDHLLYVDLHYDPWCQINVKYEFSLADTLRNLVQQYFYWIPAHMAVILIVNLGIQFSKTMPDDKFNYFVQYKSWYIVVMLHIQSIIFSKLPFLSNDLMPISNRSFYASLILHGFAMACCAFISAIIHLILKIYIKIAEKISLPTTYLTKWEITLGFLCALFATTCCKGVSLILMFLSYFYVIGFGVKNVENIQNEQDMTAETKEHEKNDNKENIDKTPKEKQPIDQQSISKIGFKNLTYHITLMSLVMLLIIINFGDIIAWLKSILFATPYVSTNIPTTLFLTPSMFVVYLLPVFWHLKAPRKIDANSHFSQILNATAVASLLLCTEKIYRLNYVIPFVLILLLSKEFLSIRQN